MGRRKIEGKGEGKGATLKFAGQLGNLGIFTNSYDVEIQEDEHLLRVIRYVERNTMRAGLAERAEIRPWSSLQPTADGPRLNPSPVLRGVDWTSFVDAPMTEAELAAIRLSLRRDRPYGGENWTVQTAALLGLESCLRPRGHPCKAATSDEPSEVTTPEWT